MDVSTVVIKPVLMVFGTEAERVCSTFFDTAANSFPFTRKRVSVAEKMKVPPRPLAGVTLELQLEELAGHLGLCRLTHSASSTASFCGWVAVVGGSQLYEPGGDRSSILHPPRMDRVRSTSLRSRRLTMM